MIRENLQRKRKYRKKMRILAIASSAAAVLILAFLIPSLLPSTSLPAEQPIRFFAANNNDEHVVLQMDGRSEQQLLTDSVMDVKDWKTVAADISADAIAMAQRNAERNGLTNMDFLCEDTFELLPRLEKEGHPYDFIILDPPAFTKARRTVENAMRGYKEINYRAMKLLPRGGYLATASCSHFATEELFIKMLRSAAKDAHRQLRQIEVRQQAPDHPILWGVPETNYLKFFLFQVI